jgi:hypothetical protein
VKRWVGGGERERGREGERERGGEGERERDEEEVGEDVEYKNGVGID